MKDNLCILRISTVRGDSFKFFFPSTVLWLGKLKLKTRASYLKWMGEVLILDVRV